MELRVAHPSAPTLGTGILPGIRGCALCLLAGALFASGVCAQDVPPVLTINEVAPGSLEAVVNPASTSSSKAVAAKTPEEQRIAELLKLKFDRSPASILQTLTTSAEGGAPEKNVVENFRRNVVAGRWKEVGAILKSLSETEQVQVYEYLLKELDRVPAPAPGQQQVAGPTPSPTLLVEDIAELADIAPANLTDDQLKLLGALLTRVLATSNYIEPLLKRLNDGTAQLGGSDLRKRELAAQLLLNANRDLDAAKLLPPLDAGRETAAIGLLEKHARCAFSEGRLGPKKDAIERGWQLNQMLLAVADCPADFRQRAWGRGVEMLPFLANATAVQWLKDIFLKQPEQGLTMLTAVGSQVAKDRFNRDTAQRKKNLELQRLVVDSLLPVLERRGQWQPALNLFATNWMEEADYAKRLHVPPRSQNVQFDEYGNQIYYGSQISSQSSNNPNQLPPIPIVEVLSIAPGEAWLATLDPSLLPRALALLTELNLKLEDDAKALPYLEQIAPIQPKETLRMANDLLRVWAGAHDPQRVVPQRRSNVYYGMGSPYGMRPQGIPLTRALQQRNLDELSALLQRLRRLPIPPLDDAAIVNAFTIAHSQAEVFRVESIELVLGKLDEMKPETLAELLQTMRQRLAGQWRKPNVQQQAKTQRSDAQIDAEVLRGYELLGGLLQAGVERQPKDWRLHLAQAATWFDWAEFQYGKKVDLAIYVEKRDRAFEAFHHAAELYAEKLPALEEKEETPVAYQQWLNANLGASDLGFVTRQQEPSAKHLERIRESILALPGAAGERHLAALAKAVAGSADSLPANLKPGYMRAAFRIVGERPESTEIRNLVTYYDGLLREIEVHLRVDGDATVGHAQPFGVFLTVRHTAALERENSGGFGKYLRNQSQNQFYYNPYGTAPIDYRDELDKQMREKLSEGFEILSLTFHDEKVQSRGYGPAGWRETPLVYLLLKAKDASVDRIPSLRLDLDFVDKRGPVVLPVQSAVQLLDARPTAAPPRPVANLEVTHTLDDRTRAEGKLTLETKAAAKGLIPPFNELFDFVPAGFKIDDLTDSGPAVQRLDSEGEQLAAASERNWLIKLSADSSAGRTALFHFPKPKSNELKVAYKRYEDADLIEVTPEVALAGMPLQRMQIWRWIVLAAVATGAAAFWAIRIRRRPADEKREFTYSLPATITPFNALQLLRQIHADPQLALSNEHRNELTETINGIETYYFGPNRNGSSAPDLDSIGRHWVGRVRGIGG